MAMRAEVRQASSHATVKVEGRTEADTHLGVIGTCLVMNTVAVDEIFQGQV